MALGRALTGVSCSFTTGAVEVSGPIERFEGRFDLELKKINFKIKYSLGGTESFRGRIVFSHYHLLATFYRN